MAGLWWAMLAGSALLSLLVFALLALAFRKRAVAEALRPRLWIGWLGLVMPSVVLLVLLIASLSIGAGTLPARADGAMTIEVVARRYAWDVRYPDGRRSEGVIHIPAGRPVDLRIDAVDVVHSLWIPRLAGKMDAIPGHTNTLRVRADHPGTYRGECAEYCGTGHKDHQFTVIAHDAAGWASFNRGGAR